MPPIIRVLAELLLLVCLGVIEGTPQLDGVGGGGGGGRGSVGSTGSVPSQFPTT